MKFKVLYEDNHIIVVEKPVNIPTQADESEDMDMLTLVKNYLKEKYNKPGNVYLGLVHRLDRPVGGVMVFAKTSKAASRLSEQIRKNEISKTYVAMVHGKTLNHDRLEHYLIKDEKTNTSRVVSSSVKGAKNAILEYKLIEYIKEQNMSLIEVNLLTGRHHQIRVQMANTHHPIYGDQRYGTLNEKGVQIHLFAHKLEFKHPVTKELLTFESHPKWM